MTTKTTSKSKAKTTVKANAKKAKAAQSGVSKSTDLLATISAVLGFIALILAPVRVIDGLSPLVAAVACFLVLICIIKGDGGWKVMTAMILSVISFAIVVMMQWMMQLSMLDSSVNHLFNEQNSAGSSVVETVPEDSGSSESE